MNQIGDRPFLGRVESGRLENPHLHLGAFHFYSHRFGARQIDLVKQLDVIVDCPRKFGALVRTTDT